MPHRTFKSSYKKPAAFPGAVLKLPPLKQALAKQQVKSRYPGTLIGYKENKTVRH